MKLEEARVALRPRTMLELLDLGLGLSMGPFARLYAKLGVALLLPALAATLGAHWGLGWDWPEVWLLALGLTTILQGAFTIAAGRMMFAEEPRMGEILGAFVRRFPAYFGALLLTRFALLVCSPLYIAVVPLLWGWGRCAYMHEACLLEQAGPIDAVKRGSNLASDATLTTGLLMFVMSVAGVGFIYVAEAFINVGLIDFVLQLGHPLGELASEGGSAAAMFGLFFAVPYWSTVRFLAYIDRRTRRDGWDIQLRFMTLAAEDADDASDVDGEGGRAA